MNNMNYVKTGKKLGARYIAVQGMAAALYVALTLAIAPLGYGPIQLRFSELLVLLVFIDSGYIPAMVIGCAIANVFSPLGIYDVAFGTFGTLCTCMAISRTKNPFIATLWPTVFCVFVGFEFWLFGSPFLFTTATVMLGEFAVVTCVGYPLLKKLFKNEALISRLRLK